MTYKNGAWGGARHFIHDDPAFVPFAEMYLFNILEQDAQTPTQEIVAKLHARPCVAGCQQDLGL